LIACGILFWFRALEPARALIGRDDGQRRLAFLAGTAAIALGTLAKGPVAPAVVLMVIGVWLAWEARHRAGVVWPRRRTIVLALAVFVVIAAPWFVLLAVRMGPNALVELIGHYTVGRYTGVIENQRGPWWYYFPVLILGFFPWIAFVPVAAARIVRDAREDTGAFVRLAIVWAVIPFVFFSFAQTKLPNYIALELPALAIIVAQWFDRVSEGRDRVAALISAAVVPLTVGCIALAIGIFGRQNKLPIEALSAQLLTLGIGMLVGSLATVVAFARAPWRAAAPYVLSATSIGLMLFIAFIAEPAAEAFKPIPEFARIINAQRKPGDIVAIRDVAGSNALAFYTAPGIKTIDADREQSFVSIICPTGTSFVVTRRTDIDALTTLATKLQRTATILDTKGRATLLRINGKDCPHD
jgi:4-amino-4-deoxy-L-arabinose transferase-like glycosyltransferase